MFPARYKDYKRRNIRKGPSKNYGKWYSNKKRNQNYRYQHNKDEYGGKSRWKYPPKPVCYKCGNTRHYENKCSFKREGQSLGVKLEDKTKLEDYIKGSRCAIRGKKGHKETNFP